MSRLCLEVLDTRLTKRGAGGGIGVAELTDERRKIAEKLND